MSVPPGAQSYRLTSGEQFYWNGHDGRWVFPATGHRMTPEQLEQLRSQRIGLQEFLLSQTSLQQSPDPRSLLSTSAPSLSTPTPLSRGFQHSGNYVTESASNSGGGHVDYRPPVAYDKTPQNANAAHQTVGGQSAFATATTGYPLIPPQARYTKTTLTPSQAVGQSGYNATQYRPPSNPPIVNGSAYVSKPTYAQNFPNPAAGYPAANNTLARGLVADSASKYAPQYGQRPPLPEPSTTSTASPRRPSVNSSSVRPSSTQRSNSGATGSATDQVAASFGQMALHSASNPQQMRYGRDQNTQVAFNNLYGPPHVTTAKDLLREGIHAQVLIRGSPGESEEFDEGYRIRKQPRRFFVQGKVFRVLWSEPAGDGNETVTSYTKDARFGQGIHSKVRRFVVIREGDNYCAAVPIMTYGDQGVAKAHVKKSDCAIIYIGKTPPKPRDNERAFRPGEAPMRPNPIRVDPDERGTILSAMSRINFGKVSTIEHNVKVKSFGMVNRDSMRDLLYQFREVWNEMFEPSQLLAPPIGVAGPSNVQSPTVTYATSSKSHDHMRPPAPKDVARQSAPSVASQTRSTRSHRSIPSNTARSSRSGPTNVSNAPRRQDVIEESDDSDK